MPPSPACQVTSRPSGPAAHAFQGGGAPLGDGEGEGHLSAALGTKWAHGVNVRLVLERQGAQRYIKVRWGWPRCDLTYLVCPRVLLHQLGGTVA